MRLMDLLLYPGLPPDIFAKLLITIGDVIRGNEIIQQFMGMESFRNYMSHKN